MTQATFIVQPMKTHACYVPRDLKNMNFLLCDLSVSVVIGPTVPLMSSPTSQYTSAYSRERGGKEREREREGGREE